MNVGRKEIERFAELVRADEREACCSPEVLNRAAINADDSPAVVVQKYRASILARGNTILDFPVVIDETIPPGMFKVVTKP